jgi:hypothetical protein
MHFFKEKNNQHLDEFDEEQRLYEMAGIEFDDGESHPELRVKVLSESYGSIEFARTSFVEIRVQSLLEQKRATSEKPGDNPANPETEISNYPLRGISENQPISPRVNKLKAKKIGGYLSMLSGSILIAVAILYFSLGGIKMGVSVLIIGLTIVAFGLMLLSPFPKKNSAD